MSLFRRNGLYVIDIDYPYNPPRWLHHLTSWEVADVQWSPHSARPSWVISTSNQKALLWNLDLPSSRAIERVIHGHSRAITDINFHSRDPEILATSSIDSYIHCWDLRDPRKPSQSFSDFFSGANQVKWNRHDSHILASSHDNRILVWDERHNSVPIRKIPAHSLKVNGLDFSRTSRNCLLSCSNDMTVKFWDLSDQSSDSGIPEFTIQTNFPVGRARHTPFGTGCGIMPSRGGNNSFFLVDIDPKNIPHQSTCKLKPVHEFSAHSEPLKEFLWRSRGGNDPNCEDREFQLVTWARDNDVRLWPVSQEIIENVNYVRGNPINMPLTRRGALYKTYHTEPEIDDKTSIRTPFKMPRGSFGSSPILIPTLSLRPHTVQIHTHHHAPAIMTRSGGPSAYSLDPRRDIFKWVSGIRVGQSALNPGDSPPSGGNDNDVLHPSDSILPANLGEEISQVGHKFPRIVFENISVSTGDLTITMNAAPPASLGEYENTNELIFLRVYIKFPPNYPAFPPIFSIEDNFKLSSEAIKSLELELTAFSTKLASLEKYCLEPCLRILLGEKVSLHDYCDDDVLQIDVLNEQDRQNESDDSFGSNRRNPYSTPLSSSPSSTDELDLLRDVHLPIPSIPAIDNTPIPRTCGAVWSKSGVLVCFFTQKKRDKQNIHDSHFRLDHTLSRITSLSNDFFDYKDDYGTGNDEDDDSFIYSSSNDGFFDMQWNIQGRSRHQNGYPHSGRYGPLSVTGRSQGTHSKFQNSSEISKNTIHIMDFRHLIPARLELAVEYAIMGSPPSLLCQHNSLVAEKYGCTELANCWRLLEMILTTEVSLPNINMCLKDNTTDPGTIDMMNYVYGGFQWGNHPFGRRWLIEQLFDYFEKRQDPQMLANMSCIFAAVPFYSPLSLSSIPSFINVSNHQKNFSSYQIENLQSFLTKFDELTQINAAISAPPSNAISSLARAPELINLGGTNSENIVTSQNWEFGLDSKSEPERIHDDLFTKDDILAVSASPEKFSTAKRAVAGIFSRTGSISYSNNQHPGKNQIGNIPFYNQNNMAQNISSISTPFPSTVGTPLTQSGNNSVKSNTTTNTGKNTPPKKTNHDSELFGTMFSGPSTTPGSRLVSRNSYNHALNNLDSHEINTTLKFRGPNGSLVPSARLTILNEELLDDPESLKPAPLLDVSKENKYKGYRMQYAGILFSWGLKIESLEVLKFNYINDPTASSNRLKNQWQNNGKNSYPELQKIGHYHNGHSRSSVNTFKQKFARSSEFDSLHLADIKFHIYKQTFVSSNSKSSNINEISYRSCQYCGLTVTSHERYFVCLSCEHILHVKCAEDWFMLEGLSECPSGCGCFCLEVIH